MSYSFRYRLSANPKRFPSFLNYKIKVTDGENETIYVTFTEIARKYKMSLSSILKKFNGGDVKKLSHLKMEKYYG